MCKHTEKRAYTTPATCALAGCNCYTRQAALQAQLTHEHRRAAFRHLVGKRCCVGVMWLYTHRRPLSNTASANALLIKLLGTEAPVMTPNDAYFSFLP